MFILKICISTKHLRISDSSWTVSWLVRFHWVKMGASSCSLSWGYPKVSGTLLDWWRLFQCFKWDSWISYHFYDLNYRQQITKLCLWVFKLRGGAAIPRFLLSSSFSQDITCYNSDIHLQSLKIWERNNNVEMTLLYQPQITMHTQVKIATS